MDYSQKGRPESLLCCKYTSISRKAQGLGIFFFQALLYSAKSRTAFNPKMKKKTTLVSSAAAPKTPPIQGISQKHPSSFRSRHNTFINNHLPTELSSGHLSAHASSLPCREAKIVWRTKHFFSQSNEKSISAERFFVWLRLIPALRDERGLKDN